MKHSLWSLSLVGLLSLVIAPFGSAKTADGKPLVVFIAGNQSHGPGEHEHNAGVQLLAKCLQQGAPEVATKVHLNAEWPSPEEIAQADSIVIYSDGGGGHPLIQGDHLNSLKGAMNRGCGLVCLHYAVEFPADKGGPEALAWMGGFFEANWSVNPHWTANFKDLPPHPISNGVQPFSTNDEWYFHMRFNDKEGKLTHVLKDVPPAETMKRGDGPHEGNPAVRAEVAAGKPQTTAWAFDRANGGRGFGFTGGHFHKGWGNDDQRKLVLNAILWTAHVEVPPNGVASKITDKDLEVNLDDKSPKKPKPSAAVPTGKGKPVAKTGVVIKGKVETLKADLKGAKELYLLVTDAGDGFVADWADWIEPVLVMADGSKKKLTDLKPKTAQVGWGHLGINQNADGKPMKVDGQPVPIGFGAHAPSLIAFDLPDGAVSFETKAGLDNGGTDQDSGGTVAFAVFTEAPDVKLVASSNGGGKQGEKGYGLEAAQENMETFKTPDGLTPTLFAAEPMIQNPTNIDIDPRGRIWATECVNYRKWMDQRAEGDRVVILEDTNGDGLADKEKTFYQSKDLTNPLGICVLPQKKGTKVIVSAAPNVWLLTDADGDDVAEDAKVIFKVGGVWNYDHQIHSFVFGPDGKFYFNAGNSITELTWPDGKIVTDVAGNKITNQGKPYRQGMVFRCDLDLETGQASNVETLANNFRNNYEVCVDSFGTMWQSDNDDDGNQGVRINYVMEHGNYGFTDEITGAGWQSPRTNLEPEIPRRHWHLNDPGVVPNLLQTGAGSPTGILVNEGKGLGDQFKNEIIHCDAGPRTTRAYPVEKDGAGYKAKMVDILTSNDSWYRVSDLCIAPDGSLLVADWYDPGVGGHNMGDNTPGKMRGRIYRVAQTGAKSETPKVNVSTPEGAVAALTSPNRATQYVAWTALHEMGAKAEPALLTLWKSESPRLRARALGLLTQIDGRQTQYLTAGLQDPDSDVRVAAIRLASSLGKTGGYDTTPLMENAELGRKLVRDPSPQVRRQIALALHGGEDIEGIWTALALQHDGKDRWYLEALGIGAAGNEDACFDAWLEKVGDQWNTPAGRDIIWRMRSAKAAGLLAQILEDQSVADSDKPRFVRSFDFLPDGEPKTKALIELATAGKAGEELAREALTRLKGNRDSAVVTAVNTELAKAKGTPAFVELVKDFGINGQGPALLDTALKLSGTPAGAEALRLVYEDPKADDLLREKLAGPQSAEVATLLATSGIKRALETLVAIAAGANNADEKLRAAAVKGLAKTQDGAAKLIDLAKNGRLTDPLKQDATAALHMVQYAALQMEIDQLFPAPQALGGQPLPPISELVKMKGDAAKGRAIFERAESSC
ncbi:MAG: PVC-type heme-binding CxxCH protein, partial [Chthoniobacteraceae bacterium]